MWSFFYYFLLASQLALPGGAGTALAQPIASTSQSSVNVRSQVAGSSSSAQPGELSDAGKAPVASFNPLSLTFSAQTIGVPSSPQALKLRNTGNAPLKISSLAVTGDFSETDNCGSSVLAGKSCTIKVRFTPQASWTRQGLLVVNDNAAPGSQSAILAGMGSSGGVPKPSVNTLTFDSQTVGTSSSPQSVTLTNNGTGTIYINGITASGDFSQTNNCKSTLTEGSQCTLYVTFTPTWSGTRGGEVVLNYFDPPLIQPISLSGTGTAPNTDVAVTPQVASLTSTQTVQFQATQNGVPTNNVTWLVDGVVGGNSSVGTISSSGLYTPPTSSGSHTVTATSNQDGQSASVPLFVDTYAGTFTQHNDNARTGQNLNEIGLSPANVNPVQFGKLFSYAVDGFVYAQPLYVAGVTIPGQGVHNVVYVATEHDSVFAFDADGGTPNQLWQVSFINPGNGVTTVPSTDYEGHYTDIVPEIGITGTPVIDPTANLLYVVAKTKELVGGNYVYVQRLHALDITTGAEAANSPVVIQASVKGKGVGNDGHGNVPFDSFLELQRPGLLLLNGVVYIAWGSTGDQYPFHGWVIGYQTGSLQQVAAYNTTRNLGGGGIWQGGAGLAADAEGNIFVQTSNGGFDANQKGGLDYGDSFLRLSTTNGLQVAGYFTPFDQQYLKVNNLDLGSGGSLLLPDQSGQYPHLLIGGGKTGRIFLVNRDAMGGHNSSEDHVVQEIVSAFDNGQNVSGIRGLPAYWQNQIYFGAVIEQLATFPLANGLLSAYPLAQGSAVFNYPGATPAISANGQTGGILWALQTNQFAKPGPAVLYAYDATNIGLELYDSNMNASRDAAGPAVKFSVPTVANAKVYIGAQYELDVYGLLP